MKDITRKDITRKDTRRVVGNIMTLKILQIQRRKTLVSLCMAFLSLFLAVGYMSTTTVSAQMAQNAQTTTNLTPVQANKNANAKSQDKEVVNLQPQNSGQGNGNGQAQNNGQNNGQGNSAQNASNGSVVTTVVTTPIEETTTTTNQAVCDALAMQIINNLATYPDWQLSLNDTNGNVQGFGEMGTNGLELQLFNSNDTELNLYYFTDQQAITIANRSGLRISLFEADASSNNSAGTTANSNDTINIIINATIGPDGSALPINECILPFEQVFPNYSIIAN